MKVKIRGLLFAGFAAAVFAQSAMAVVPPTIQYPSNEGTDATEKDNLKKTVTSKYYTNETFQERLAGTPSTSPDTALTEDPTKGVTEEAAFIGWNYGQGGINKEWVKLTGKPQLNSESTGDNDTEYVKIVHSTNGQNKSHHVQINESAIAGNANDILNATAEATSLAKGKLATARAVNALLDREGTANSATNTSTITASSTDNTVPTSKNVYDFVQSAVVDGDLYQPKVAVDNTNSVLRVGQWVPASGSQANNDYVEAHADWVQIRAYAEGGSNTDTGYITITNATSRGVYDINLNNNMVVNADDALVTAGTSATGSNNKKLTTAKAVYDYAQPRVPNASENGKVAIGYKADANTASTWKLLREDARGDAIKYVELALDSESGNYDINIYGNKMVSSGADILVPANGHKLVKASAVKDLLGGNTLPAMPSACQVANVHCALVSKVTTPASGDDPAVVALEWTVMAQSD